MTPTIHAAYDASTEEVQGIYRSDIHSTIPSPSLVITPAEHAQALLDQEAGKSLKVTAGVLVSSLTPVSLGTHRSRAKREVDADAADKVSGIFPFGDSQSFLFMSRVHEAALASPDGARTQTKYPLLAAKVLAEGGAVTHASLGVSGAGTEAEFAAHRTSLAPIEEVRLKAHIDLDAAIDDAAIDAVMAAIVWPA